MSRSYDDRPSLWNTCLRTRNTSLTFTRSHMYAALLVLQYSQHARLASEPPNSTVAQTFDPRCHKDGTSSVGLIESVYDRIRATPMYHCITRHTHPRPVRGTYSPHTAQHEPSASKRTQRAELPASQTSVSSSSEPQCLCITMLQSTSYLLLSKPCSTTRQDSALASEAASRKMCYRPENKRVRLLATSCTSYTSCLCEEYRHRPRVRMWSGVAGWSFVLLCLTTADAFAVYCFPKQGASVREAAESKLSHVAFSGHPVIEQ